jgi:hypothetical protein
MNQRDFDKKEKEILDRYRKSRDEARTNGLVSKIPTTSEPQVGYLIYNRFGNELNSNVEQFSTDVNQSLNGRSIIYSADIVHQTIADFSVKPLEEIEGEFPNYEILDKLIKATKRARDNFVDNPVNSNDRPNPATMFFNYIHNADSVILDPYWNRGNPYLIEAVASETDKESLGVRKAWGRHITVSRFSEDILPQEMKRFNELLGGKYLASYPNASNDGDVIYAQSLNVGFFDLSKSGFHLSSHESFYF